MSSESSISRLSSQLEKEYHTIPVESKVEILYHLCNLALEQAGIQ